MTANIITSAVNHRRICCAQSWLQGRAAAEEVLTIATTLGAANDLLRGVTKQKGRIHVGSPHAVPIGCYYRCARRGSARLIPLSRIGANAIVA